MADSVSSAILGARLRWGLIAAAVCVAALLLGFAGYNYATSLELASAVSDGQLEGYLRAFGRTTARIRSGTPVEDAMAELMASPEGEGLTYIAVLDDSAAVLFQMGTPTAPLPSQVPTRPRVTNQISSGLLQAIVLMPLGPRLGRGRAPEWGLPPDAGAGRPEPHAPPGQGVPAPGPPEQGPGAGGRSPDGQDPPDGPPPPPPDGLPPPMPDEPQPEEGAACPTEGAGPDAAGAEVRGPGEGRPAARGWEMGRAPWVVFEVEPTLSRMLRQRAMGTLIAAILASIILVLAVARLWRWSLRMELERMEAQRRANLAHLGEMSAVLAHEIRNPLASLKGHAQLLSEQLDEGTRQKDKVDRIIKEAVRLQYLSTEILDFVRQGTLHRQRTEVEPFIRDLTGDDVDVDLGGAPTHFPMDPSRMRQVLVNLLQNAAQASPQGARVDLAVREADGQLILMVRDRGAGIPAGQEEVIFEPFKSLRTRGVGLGLAISRRIVELHGGTLKAANHPEGGAVFTARIPRTAES